VNENNAFDGFQNNLIVGVGGVQEYQKLLKLNSGDIILEQITLLYHPNISQKWKTMKMNEPPKPTYHFSNEEAFFASLRLLEQELKKLGEISNGNSSILEYLANKYPKTIHHVLLTLTIRVHEVFDPSQKFQALYQLSFFIQLLMNTHPDSSSRKIFELTKGYVCSFVMGAFLRFLSSFKEGSFLRAIVIVFTELLENIVKNAPAEIDGYYNQIVNKLIEKVTTHPDLTEVLKGPLNYLIIQKNNELKPYIASLNPFPTTNDAFLEYRKIHEEYQQQIFKESLELVKKLQDKKFQDECKDDVLHNLIQLLIQVVTESEDENVRYEAGRCLGQIGPVDLSVLVLPQHEKSNKLIYNLTKPNIEVSMIQIILQYLKDDEDVYIVQTSGQVLSNLLTLKEFRNNPVERLRLLQPFLNSQVGVETKE